MDSGHRTINDYQNPEYILLEGATKCSPKPEDEYMSMGPHSDRSAHPILDPVPRSNAQNEFYWDINDFKKPVDADYLTTEENTYDDTVPLPITPAKHVTRRRWRVVIGLLVILVIGLMASNGLFAFWYYQQCDSHDVIRTEIPKIAELRDGEPGYMKAKFSTNVTTMSTITPTTLQQYEVSCRHGYVLHDQRCFLISTDPVSRPVAMDTCSQTGGRLVTVGDQQTMTAVSDVLDVMNVQADEPVHNIALSSNGSTCSASSAWSSDFSCWKAIDGSESPVSSEWVIQTRGTAIGSWIQIDFQAPYMVSQVQILTRCYSGYQNKGFNMIFSDGTIEQGQITRAYGTDRSRCEGVGWDVYNVTPRLTSYVKIQITSAYTNGYNGLREVKVMGKTVPLTQYWTNGRLVGDNWMSGNDVIRTNPWAPSGEHQNGACLCVLGSGCRRCECADHHVGFVCEADSTKT